MSSAIAIPSFQKHDLQQPWFLITISSGGQTVLYHASYSGTSFLLLTRLHEVYQDVLYDRERPPSSRLLAVSISMRFQLTSSDDDPSGILKAYIDSARTKRTFGKEVSFYLRANEIRQLASDQNINIVVSSDTTLKSGEKYSLKDQIRDSARKAFLIAVSGSICMEDLFALISKGLKDEDLNLPLTHGDLATYRNCIGFSRFQSHQQWLIPPVLSESTFLTYGVDRCVPIQREESPIIPGTGSRIYRASVDTDYYEIASLKSLPNDPSLSQRLAVHEINTASPEQQEHAQNRIQVAKFIATHVQHEHVVKPFGSFALRSTFPGETMQYILTELHDADLSILYKRNKPPSAADDWIRRQVRGLAGALALMHTPRDGDFAVHHGIKSQTIAVFSQQCKLSLSTRCRIQASDNSGIVSISPAVSPYSPPETTSGYLTGRPHDVWSLGCVFLELMVWCTQGQNECRDFIEAAGGKYAPQYWFLEEGGETVLQKIVKQQLNTLQGWEQGKWVNFVLVIRRMLATDVSSRITANQLVAALNSSTRPI